MTKTMLLSSQRFYHPDAFCHPDAGGICDPSANRSDASFLSMTKTMLYHPDAFVIPMLLSSRRRRAITTKGGQVSESSEFTKNQIIERTIREKTNAVTAILSGLSLSQAQYVLQLTAEELDVHLIVKSFN